jgi:Ras-related GTP-binding protein A/B
MISDTEKKSGNSKVLLMGKENVGKTSMKTVMFANSAPKETMVLGYTHGVSEFKLNLLGNLKINLLDCGGQDEFMEQYFDSKKDDIFPDTEIMIFVIESMDLPENEIKKTKDIVYLEK